MAHFIVLASFTDQGIKNVKDTVKRADAFKALASKQGVTVESIYWTLGAYDVVAVCNAKDDKSMTAVGLAVGSLGNVRTQTLLAYSATDMADILAKVG
jgi:uncharacterized protein with GYD domain